MGVRFATAATTTILNASLTNATEIIVATTPPLNLLFDSAQVFLLFYFNITTPAGATAFNYKLRRGTTVAGANILAAGSPSVAASMTYSLSGCYSDTPGIVAEQQYTLTMTNTSGGGAGSANDVSVIAFVL